MTADGVTTQGLGSGITEVGNGRIHVVYHQPSDKRLILTVTPDSPVQLLTRHAANLRWRWRELYDWVLGCNVDSPHMASAIIIRLDPKLLSEALKKSASLPPGESPQAGLARELASHLAWSYGMDRKILRPQAIDAHRSSEAT